VSAVCVCVYKRSYRGSVGNGGFTRPEKMSGGKLTALFYEFQCNDIEFRMYVRTIHTVT